MKLISTLLVIAAIVLCVIGSGCTTHSGSRDFIPGEGWVPND